MNLNANWQLKIRDKVWKDVEFIQGDSLENLTIINSLAILCCG